MRSGFSLLFCRNSLFGSAGFPDREPGNRPGIPLSFCPEWKRPGETGTRSK
jgi:hypothetical protein